ncbi:hypothetical protein NMG60_11013486 [Bertholletia excelsa]
MGRATRWLRGLFGAKKDREQQQKDHRSAGGLCHNPATIPPNITPAEAAWLRSFYDETTENEQSKHAIAVAAATAAAADAAVAAAQAAVAVVRLTSNGRGTMFAGGRERWAAVKIQSVFRAYLARKALKALKGLVKLQALVRGFLVRKQATATLLGMQALLRAQATVRAQKSLCLSNHSDNFRNFRARKSVERFDDTRSEYVTTIHSRRLSAFFDTSASAIEESPKIVEVDPGRPKPRSRRTATSFSDSGDDPFGPTLSSPLPCRAPTRLSIPDCRNCFDVAVAGDWGLPGVDECRISTAQSTPRVVTPAKSASSESIFRTNPNYMANTQSFRAKLRSHSAPKQRPEPGSKRRVSLHEMMESRNSLSGVRMQRSCSQAQEVVNFKNCVIGKLNRSSEREYYVQRRW